LNRHLLAYDINPNALEITKKALDFDHKTKSKIELKLNDTRVLDFLKDESVDFVLTHPPYADIIKYSEGKIDNDLSNIRDIDAFCDEMEIIAKEYFRVLKK
jgi:DNA modification methylase